MFQTGGGRPLLEPGPGRRHAVPDGPRLDSARAGERRCPREGAQPGGERTRDSKTGRERAALPEGEEGHSHAGP